MISRQYERWFLDRDVHTRKLVFVPGYRAFYTGHGQYVPISDNGGNRRERY